ncbi:MAG: hypothetical protein ACOZB3_06130 [Calditrichota bacterium]
MNSIALIVAIAIVAIVVVAMFLHSASKRLCPHCHTMMPKKVTLCPRCHKNIPLNY